MTKSYRDELDDIIINGIGWTKVVSSLTSKLDNAFANYGKHVECPFTLDHSQDSGSLKKFRVYNDNGCSFDVDGAVICSCNSNKTRYKFQLLLDLGVGNSFSDVLRKVKNLVGGGSASKENTEVKQTRSYIPKLSNDNSEQKVEYRRKILKEVASELLPLNHGDAYPARAYFEKRGLLLDSMIKISKFHPDLDYYGDLENGKRGIIGSSPAIVSVMSDASGKPTTLHRIYVNAHGEKADFGEGNPVKSVMPSVISGELSGSSLKVFNHDDRTLNVTEGLEVAISLGPIIKESVWAGYSATMLGSMNVPKHRFDMVRIWADYDPMSEDGKRGGAGMKYALKLESRLLKEGFRVQVCIPSNKESDDLKIDWEDIVMRDSVYSIKDDGQKVQKLVESICTKAKLDSYRNIVESLNIIEVA